MAANRRKPQQPVIMFHEPAIINAAQVFTNLAAAGAGFMAAIGAGPVFMTGQIGPVLALAVGLTLVLGGMLGTVTVLLGMWWLERVALLIVGLGWAMILPAALTFAVSGRNPGIWLVVALVFAALGDVFKRYRRIDWAYLDPARK
jgi:hypothetical protein